MTGESICKFFETLKLEAYICPAGKPTIGWGHTYNVKLGQKISVAQAEVFFDHDYQEAEEDVKSLVKVPLDEHQLGALTSFVFNLGKGNLAKSTLLKKLNALDYTGAGAEFTKWNKATVNGKLVELAGLTKRRKCERQLFEGFSNG